MPQMAPYNWLLLNIMFSSLMLFYISYMYFTPNYNKFILIKTFNYKKKFLKNLKW